MKHLFILVLLLCLVAPAMASISPIKTDFQNYIVMPLVTTTQGDWQFVQDPPTSTNIFNNTVGQQFSGTSTTTLPLKVSYITTSLSQTFTYTAATILSDSSSPSIVYIQNSLGHSVFFTMPSSPGRMEIAISGGTATFYFNDAIISTDSGWVTNPNYISFSCLGTGTSYWDDIVVGYADDSTIIGTIPPDWFILEDSSAPALRGLYQIDATAGGSPILKNSNNFGISYGRGIPDATTLNLINPSGTVVKSYPVANMSAQLVIPLADLSVGGAPIQNGKWSVKLADDPETSYFWVTTTGALVSWDRDAYSTSDVATITWDVTNDAWNLPAPVGTVYFFWLNIQDIYGDSKLRQNIGTQTGTATYQWTTADAQGVYYATITRTSSDVGTEEVLLNYADTSLTGYVRFSGYVHNGEAQVAIPGAKVNITQLGTTQSATTDGTGMYNLTNFLTGATTAINVSATGYRQYNHSFTPLSARSIPLNFTLIAATPTVTGIATGGVVHSTPYGQPIPSAKVWIQNISSGQYCPQTTNSVGYYEGDDTAGCMLVSMRPYQIWGSKSGFSNSTIDTVVMS